MAYSAQPLREASLAARTSEMVIFSSVLRAAVKAFSSSPKMRQKDDQSLINVGLLNGPLLA